MNICTTLLWVAAFFVVSAQAQYQEVSIRRSSIKLSIFGDEKSALTSSRLGGTVGLSDATALTFSASGSYVDDVWGGGGSFGANHFVSKDLRFEIRAEGHREAEARTLSWNMGGDWVLSSLWRGAEEDGWESVIAVDGSFGKYSTAGSAIRSGASFAEPKLTFSQGLGTLFIIGVEYAAAFYGTDPQTLFERATTRRASRTTALSNLVSGLNKNRLYFFLDWLPHDQFSMGSHFETRKQAVNGEDLKIVGGWTKFHWTPFLSNQLDVSVEMPKVGENFLQYTFTTNVSF